MFYTNARSCRSQHINKLLKLYSKFSSTFSKHFLVFLCDFFFFDHSFMLPAAEERLVMSFAPELISPNTN